jgi:hypothetical protein
VLIFVLATIQALVYGWAFGIDRGDSELHLGAHIRIPRVVQYMLKYVVPVYLLGIFAAFCWQKLPSQDIYLFELGGGTMETLSGEEVPQGIRRAFADNGKPLPESVVVYRDGQADGLTGPEPQWGIENPDGELLYHVRLQWGEQLTAFEHDRGYLEKIGDSDAAFFSVMFIGVVLGFLLLMVHIAGRRWNAQGRFDHLDADNQESI